MIKFKPHWVLSRSIWLQYAANCTQGCRRRTRKHYENSACPAFMRILQLTARSFRLADGAEYHLVVVFVTESHPGGGWWSKSGAHASQSDEGGFLKFIGNQVRRLAREAISVRYFGTVCGWNLPGRGVVDGIQGTLTPLARILLILWLDLLLTLCFQD
jgi:hypothetical protein